MNVMLHDSDKNNYPNLALMKLSSYHKSKGDKVTWFSPIKSIVGLVYSSKVFTYTGQDPYLTENAKKGGIGYGLMDTLPECVEHTCPDYELYNLTYSLGFLTRGCPRTCPWCIVPKKEGSIRKHADIEEFARHKEVVLMDNNILSCNHGIEQLEKISRLGLKVDFNQGLDSRLIDDEMAKKLSKIKWRSPLRLACDHSSQIDSVRKAVELLRWHNTTPSRFFCYVLVKDIKDALERVKFLKGMYLDPFAQPYRDAKGKEPDKMLKHFARWVNHKAEFKSRSWAEYLKQHDKQGE